MRASNDLTSQEGRRIFLSCVLMDRGSSVVASMMERRERQVHVFVIAAVCVHVRLCFSDGCHKPGFCRRYLYERACAPHDTRDFACSESWFSCCVPKWTISVDMFSCVSMLAFSRRRQGFQFIGEHAPGTLSRYQRQLGRVCEYG